MNSQFPLWSPLPQWATGTPVATPLLNPVSHMAEFAHQNDICLAEKCEFGRNFRIADGQIVWSGDWIRGEATRTPGLLDCAVHTHGTAEPPSPHDFIQTLKYTVPRNNSVGMGLHMVITSTGVWVYTPNTHLCQLAAKISSNPDKMRLLMNTIYANMLMTLLIFGWIDPDHASVTNNYMGKAQRLTPGSLFHLIMKKEIYEMLTNALPKLGYMGFDLSAYLESMQQHADDLDEWFEAPVGFDIAFHAFK